MEKELAKVYEIKTKYVGHADHLPSEGRVLNRVLRATGNGWELEADQRHAELVQEALEVGQGKGVVTPGIDDNPEDGAETLDAQKSHEYRSLTARLNYLAADRPDIQFAVKELCRSMSSPRELDWTRLVKVAKYLKTRPRLVMLYPWQQQGEPAVTHSDASWAGCKVSKKSTSARDHSHRQAPDQDLRQGTVTDCAQQCRIRALRDGSRVSRVPWDHGST